MRDEPIAARSFCVVKGCTDAATQTRWITTGPDARAEVEVCWKHEEGDLDINSLELGEWGE